jgi:phage gp29-like protein
MREAYEGDAIAYLTLAEEMEERDLHYRSVLDTRKRAVTGLPIRIKAADDEDSRAVEIADDVRQQTKASGFRSTLLKGSMDALGKGYGVVEILWNKGADKWTSDFKYRDPRFFVYDQTQRNTLRLRDNQDSYHGIELPPFKFVVHEPTLKAGLQIRAGLAFAAAFSYMCKTFSITDWMTFADRYGLPIRIGRYNKGTAQKADINILRRAVANLGSDAAAVLPKEMEIEFVEASKNAGSSDFFERMADWFDRQISKLVLGQTRTADQQSSGLATASETHTPDAVRADIRDDDALELCETIQRDWLIPYVNIHYGVQDVYPQFELEIPKPKNLQLIVQAIKELTPLGGRFSQTEMRGLLGLSEPADDAEIFGTAAAPAMNIALNRQLTPSIEDELDALAAEGLGDWQQQMQPIIEPMQQATGYAELLKALQDLPEETLRPLIESLAEKAFKARGAE